MNENFSSNGFDLARVNEGFARGDGGEDSLFFWLFISVGFGSRMESEKKRKEGGGGETGQAGMDESQQIGRAHV